MHGRIQPSMPAYWRVFYTNPRAEKKCEERLQQQGVEVFLPTYVAVRQWKDRVKRVTEPLFRNYLFARVDEPGRLQVLQTPGIVRCVAFGGRIAEVNPDEIEQLRIMQNAPERLERMSDSRIPIGREVTVMNGPMCGLRGEVIEHRGEYYMVVRVEAIHQAVKVHVPAHWVEACASPVEKGL